MNERIENIEATLAVLWTARMESLAVHNDIGHRILCHAMDHLNAELKAMVSE